MRIIRNMQTFAHLLPRVDNSVARTKYGRRKTVLSPATCVLLVCFILIAEFLVEIQPTFFISFLFLLFSVFLTLIKADTSPSFASANDFSLVPLQTVVGISSYWAGSCAFYKVVHSSHSRKVSLPKSDNTQEHHGYLLIHNVRAYQGFI